MAPVGLSGYQTNKVRKFTQLYVPYKIKLHGMFFTVSTHKLCIKQKSNPKLQ